MPTVSLIILIICIVVAAGFFSYGLRLLANNNAKASSSMNLGFGIGLIGLILFAIVYGFFSL